MSLLGNLFKKVTNIFNGGSAKPTSSVTAQFPQTTNNSQQASQYYGSKYTAPTPSVAPQSYLPTVANANPKSYNAGGSINPVAAPSSAAAIQNATDSQISNYQTQQDQLRNPAPAPLPELPVFDIGDTFQKARNIASSQVSPYYENLLNTFQQQQALRKQRAQEDLDRFTKNVDTQFANTQAANAVEKGRTEQDTARNIGQLNQSESNFQQQSADQFRKAYNSLRENQAQGNLTQSGIGQLDQKQAVAEKAQGEQRQVQQIEQQRQQQNILKSRTFEDLARSEELAQKAGTLQKESKQIDYNRFAEDLLTEEVQKRRDVEQQKQQDILQRIQPTAQELFNQYIGTLRNPDQVAYANQLYGNRIRLGGGYF